MSREIKFRAWNSLTKEMEQVTQINLKNHYVQTTFNKIGYSYGQPDDVIVEQYTGPRLCYQIGDHQYSFCGR